MVQLIWNPETKADNSNGPSAASKTQSPPAANNLDDTNQPTGMFRLYGELADFKVE
jgi:hypothetical protein